MSVEIWRTPEGLLARTGKHSFALIDPTGAIVKRYDLYEGFHYTAFYVEDGQLFQHDQIPTVDDLEDSVVLSGLVADTDPDTARFVATVLGDAAVTAEAAKQRGS